VNSFSVMQPASSRTWRQPSLAPECYGLHLCTVLCLFLQVLLVGLYLLLCVLYWAWSAVQLAAELRDVLDVKHFINNKLGISDRQVRIHWSEAIATR
jgi:hypothetical protein